MKLISTLPTLVTLLSVLNLAYGQSSSPPTVSVPSPIPVGIVAAPYELEVPTTGAPVTYQVRHLPPGLAMDDGTGIISGTPTRDGTYHVTVRAENEAGRSDRIEFDIEILPLPDNLVGTYHGHVFPDRAVNGNLGSRLEVRTTTSGSATGKIISGTSIQHFTGNLHMENPESTVASLELTIPRDGDTPLLFISSFDIPTNTMAGAIVDEEANMEEPFVGVASFNGWRNAWSASNPATAYDTLHTFRLEIMEVDPAVFPLGYGFGSFSMSNPNTGTVHVVGKTSDRKTFTTSTFVGQTGEVLIYQSLYQGGGSLNGNLYVYPGATAADNTLSGTLFWIKPPNPGDRLYPNGFGFDPDGNLQPASLMVEGGAYPVPAPGGVVMGLPDDTPDNAQISFTGGGLDAEGAEFGQIFTISNPGSGLVNEATVPPNVNKVKIPTLSAALGTFSGDFTLPAAPGVAKRKAPFQGQIVNIGGTVAGYGFFLLPEAPEGSETPQTSPKNSGKVVMQAAE